MTEIERRNAAFTSTQLIRNKLAHAMRALVRIYMNKSTGRVDEDIQHAIRILESRQRYVDRVYNANYVPELAERAKIELAIGRDNGDLILIESKKHGVGRLDCRCCDCTYPEGSIASVNLSRICPHCSQGVQHAFSRETGEEIPVEVETPLYEVTLGVITLQSQRKAGYQRGILPLWACDFCAIEEIRV